MKVRKVLTDEEFQRRVGYYSQHQNMAVFVKFIGDEPFKEGSPLGVQVIGEMESKDGKKWILDPLFPEKFQGNITVWGIDEGFADMLTGMVKALKPSVVLEIGTNKGRSTRAIATGLEENDRGLMYTVDRTDHGIHTSGALTTAQGDRVLTVTGETPEVFEYHPLQELEGIDFAFLDGDHTAAGVEAELEYIDNHRAKECTVVIDNTRDEGWKDLGEYFKTYHKYPIVNLPTMTGTVIIQMKD